MEADRKKLGEIKVALDRCWDLLRQRRGFEEHRLDPNAARVRDETTLENYRE